MAAAAPLLSVSDLRVSIDAGGGSWMLVDGVSLQVGAGEVLGLVGESGSGKSLTLRSIVRLVRAPLRVAGEVRWRGANLLELPERQLNAIRGREIAVIFQEPMTALNPVLTVGEQIRESLRAHSGLDRPGCRKRAIELLDHVGIPAARARVDDYPHQFSGGMRQRAMIAIALAAEPKLLLADEPTTALDVTIQDQILKLILRLKAELGMSVVLVTHDLGVIAQSCDRVAVMYAGRVVEQAPVATLLREPRHAYTRGLLDSVPLAGHARRPLRPIGGAPPAPGERPAGCSFAPRCGYATEICQRTPPPLIAVAQEHLSACLHHARLAAEEVRS
ncbi:MAG TPA: ABC transporter ATP-binding protein [Candidatus Acidoferrum sp.]|nr:ABC transporter ATP-binding protein [Candidatus Acidoferrum sp.]